MHFNFYHMARSPFANKTQIISNNLFLLIIHSIVITFSLSTIILSFPKLEHRIVFEMGSCFAYYPLSPDRYSHLSVHSHFCPHTVSKQIYGTGQHHFLMIFHWCLLKKVHHTDFYAYHLTTNIPPPSTTTFSIQSIISLSGISLLLAEKSLRNLRYCFS